MTAMWSSLIPLILGSALVPIEIVITILLLGTPARVRTAGAWVIGMIAARLLQGVVFGLILHWGARGNSSSDPHGWIVSTVLLVVAILFLITAARELIADEDTDAPPPKWMTMLTSATPTKALGIGIGLIAVSIKFWVFTLGSIGVIGPAGLPKATNVAVYVVFVLLAVSPHLAIVGLAVLAPERSAALLDRALRWLQSHNRLIMIGLGLVFGGWFLVKALLGFGILGPQPALG